MEDQGRDDVLNRLAPEVRDYALPHFVLADELRHLVAVRRVAASEAAVIYSTRILEVLTAQALLEVDLPGDPNSFHNLDLLEQYNLMPATTRYWAHALRRLGNDVRHINRRIAPDDAELAIVFVERVLHWFFCAFEHGKRLPGLAKDRGQLELGCAPELQTLVSAFDRPDFEPGQLARQCVGGQWPGFLAAPAVPAALVEELLARQSGELAHQVLTEANRVFAEDLRVRQLTGLYWSRRGNFDEALRCLEPLAERWRDDEETVGLLAGVYKRRWLAAREEEAWLVKASRLYSRGWEASKKVSVYLGINAATTALWLGKGPEARRIAAGVRDRLLDRAGRLARFRADHDLGMNYWDHATLAETRLLLGQWGSARRTYRDAFRRHADRAEDIEVTCRQAVEGLKTLGVSPEAAETFFDAEPGRSADRPLVIGVVSESNLPPDEAFRQRIRDILSGINACEAPAPAGQVVVLSALTEPAARLVAREVLSPAVGGALRVVLQGEVHDGLAALPSAEARADFQWCVDRADAVIFPPPPPEGRERAPKRPPGTASPTPETVVAQGLGRYIAEHCHVLLVLAGGGPDVNPSAAAEAVTHADRLGRPVIRLLSKPPYTVTYHRLALLPRGQPPGGFSMYVPRPIDTSQAHLPESLSELTERLAENTHDIWARRRLAEGWTWGPARDDQAKKHPDLVPYSQLSEAEREYDRATALEAIKAITILGYRIERDE